MEVQVASFSSPGPRRNNEDAADWAVLPDGSYATCIADGVGGRPGGGIASKTAVELFMSTLRENPAADLTSIVRHIHAELIQVGKDHPGEQGLATTFSGFTLRAEKIRGVHVGDTRICVLRDKGIKQLTTDQTEVARLVKEGKISKGAALLYPRRNFLESALGGEGNPQIEGIEFQVARGDRVILTTDGLHGVLSKRKIRDLSIEYRLEQEFSDAVRRAVEGLGPVDNYTLISLSLV